MDTTHSSIAIEKDELPCLSQGEVYAKLGKALKAARRQQNLSLNQIAEHSKIRKLYLQAIEAGNQDLLPEGVYKMGYLKVYSHILKYDIQPFLEALKKPINENLAPPPLNLAQAKSAMPPKWVILVCAFFIAFLIFFM
mgnify:CR=1 FL=1